MFVQQINIQQIKAVPKKQITFTNFNNFYFGWNLENYYNIPNICQ